MKKILSHVKRNMFIYGVGSLFVVGIVQSQGWVDFGPALESADLSVDYVMGLKNQILTWSATGYGVFRTAKAIGYPLYVDSMAAKKAIADKDIMVRESETKAKEELAMVTKERAEVDRLKFQEISRQNDLLEQIRDGQKSLPDLVELLKIKVEDTKDLIDESEKV